MPVFVMGSGKSLRATRAKQPSLIHTRGAKSEGAARLSLLSKPGSVLGGIVTVAIVNLILYGFTLLIDDL